MKKTKENAEIMRFHKIMSVFTKEKNHIFVQNFSEQKNELPLVMQSSINRIQGKPIWE